MHDQRYLVLRGVLRFFCVLICSCVLVFGADDVRTWTDTTGKYSLKGSFLKLEDGKVYLKQTSGQEMVIPLHKLSTADVKLARELAKPKPAKVAPEPPPAEPRRFSGPKPLDEAAEPPLFTPVQAAAPFPDAPPLATLDWSKTKRLADTAAPTDWNVNIQSPAPKAAANNAEKKLRPISFAAIRKEDKGVDLFFKSMTFSPESQRAMVSLNNARVEIGQTLAMLDLAGGKLLGWHRASREFNPIAYAPDGERLLVVHQRDPILEIWRVTKAGIAREKRWNVRENKNDYNDNARSAMFLDDKRVLVNFGSGKLVVWDVDKPTPLVTINAESHSSGSAQLITSHDRRYCLLRYGDRLLLVDLTKLEVTASKKIEGITGFAMSPDNKSIAVLIYNEKLLVFDAATGTTQSEFRVPRPRLRGTDNVIYTGPTTVLLEDRTLFDVSKQQPLWIYYDINDAIQAGEIRWAYAQREIYKGIPDALVPFRLPHDEAQAVLAKHVPPPPEYYLKPGDGVALDLSGLKDARQIQLAEAALTKQLKELGFVVDPGAQIRLVGTIEVGKSELLNYRSFGASGGDQFVYTPRHSRLKFLLGDKVLHQRTGGNELPGGFLSSDSRETMQQKLKAAEQPNYDIFTSPKLPSRIEKDPKDAGAGKSRLTIEGWKNY